MQTNYFTTVIVHKKSNNKKSTYYLNIPYLNAEYLGLIHGDTVEVFIKVIKRANNDA
jgi:hypothetical protein